MLIIIYGEDTYRSREWLHELREKFKQKFDASGYNVASSKGNPELSEIRSAITASPFLGTRRMVICERLFEICGKEKELDRVLARIPESTIVVVWEEGDEKAFAKIPCFAQFLRKKSTTSYAFPLLRAGELERWVAKRAKTLGIIFERGALAELAGRVGSDLWQLSGELEKFAAAGKPVTVAVVKEFVRGTTPRNIFAFTDALASHDTASAIRELANERANGAAVTYLITMFARQFRLLREASNYFEYHPGATPAELAEVFSWHPFVAKKTAAQAKKFRPAELACACDAIFEADRAIKTGLRDPDTALDLLVAELLGITHTV